MTDTQSFGSAWNNKIEKEIICIHNSKSANTLEVISDQVSDQVFTVQTWFRIRFFSTCKIILYKWHKSKSVFWGLLPGKTHTLLLSYRDYRKFPKYSNTQNICCNHSKIWTMWLYHRVMSPNNADWMANSVDPDQTVPLAVWSGSALSAQACLSENLGSLW